MTRSLPQFIGIGAPKAATTWLFHCLREHPKIFIPLQKEIGFFSYLTEIDHRLDEYAEYFSDAKPGQVKGEIFVNYLENKRAPDRIKRHLGNIKLFVSLRNPVDQIYSYYWHLKRQNFHVWGDGKVNQRPHSFREALDKIPDRLLAPSYYGAHLERWIGLFGKENIHVIFYDDIQSRPDDVLRGLYRFIGVDSSFVPSALELRGSAVRRGVSPKSERHQAVHERIYDALNRRVYHPLKRVIGFKAADRIKEALRVRQLMERVFYQQGYPQMTSSERAKVLSMISDDVKRLESLVGRDLSHWRY